MVAAKRPGGVILSGGPASVLDTNAPLAPPDVQPAIEGLLENPADPDSKALESLFEDVYAELPWHLKEQRDQLLSGARAPQH